MTNARGPQQPLSGQPQQPFYPYPRQKRRVWPWVLGGILASIFLLFGGCALLVGGAAHEVAKQESERTVAAPVGTEVRDGKFSFVVTRVDTPVKTVGDNQFLQQQAQGEYILVHVEVTNTADRPQTYFGENQKLVDDQGRVFGNDTRAEMNLNEHLASEINPGNKISVVLAFDVPEGTSPAAIEFHDSMFSGGARVAVK
ncbi:DUF4352 domain-containing protein [Nocardia cyriacigeorgica]|uniref:DUF4352 domain-containing protein n=1 Tax=Nocardia cyriacigeorgica TaxID=135487 RepID=UPI002453A060|nr:DUF4352 domain-containing protein [Nocardia cyriacigeorgica]